MSLSFDNLTVYSVLPQIQKKTLKISDWLHYYLERIHHRESLIHAWTYLNIASAKQQAYHWDQQLNNQLLEHYPLLGVPVGVKDIFATHDMPTEWGTEIYRDRYLNNEAAVVTTLKAAGAIILGKTATTELATAAAGPTTNPHNVNHTPGGSSSGSAAAVAAGMVPVAIGSQTMGSVLRPAAYCGVFGFKPSFGAISRNGMMPVCSDLDHVGIFARCIEDIQHVFAVLAELCDRPLGATPQRAPLRLGFIPTPHWEQATPVVQSRLQQAISVLQQATISVETLSLPSPLQDYWETVQILCAYGLYSHHGDLLQRHPEQCSPSLIRWLQKGQMISEGTYRTAQIYRRDCQAALAPLWQHYDALLSPVTLGPAPLGLNNTGSPIFCGLWTLCGVPALNIPLGQTENGLPLGCQLVGPMAEDIRLLTIAKQCWIHFRKAFGGIRLII